MSNPHNIVIADEFYKAATIAWESYPLRIWLCTGLTLMTLGAVGFVADMFKTIPEPELDPQPEPDRLRTYGGDFDLVARQRRWATQAPSHAAPRPAPADIAVSADDAFERWFEACVRLPNNPTPSDIIPLEHWVRSYMQYCDNNGLQRLSEADVLGLMAQYAEANGDVIDEGVYVGGQLIG